MSVFVRKHTGLIRFWSTLETSLLKSKIGKPIQKPIFICGLARSGTTIVLHLLNAHSQTGSFLYRDLPFVEVPYFWSFVSGSYYGRRKREQRPHGDAIDIDPSSPDAFEELIWMQHLEKYYDDGFCKVLDEHYKDDELEKTLRAVINKILFVRGSKSRYLSKGNYNLFRLKYILQMFPDAKIILCTRDASEQAESMSKVHERFMELSNKDPSFAKQLNILGHFEFGPFRKAIRLDGGNYDKTILHWQHGEEYEGYLQQWHDVYDFARKNYSDNPNIYWLDNADLVSKKHDTIQNLLQFCELSEEGKIFSVNDK